MKTKKVLVSANFILTYCVTYIKHYLKNKPNEKIFIFSINDCGFFKFKRN